MARSGGHPQGKRRTAAVLGLHGPGSEGNLASDNENTPDAVTTTTPQDEQDKPSERPHERPARENGPTRDQSNAAPQEGAPPSEPRPQAAADRPEQGQGGGGGHHGGHRRNKPPAQAKNGSPTLDLVELKDMSIQRLNQVAKDMNVAGAAGLRKQELIFKILQTQAEKSGLIFSEGVLECLPESIGQAFERPDLLGRRARMPARWIRLPARAGVQLSAGSRRRVRFAVADPPLRSPHRRHHLRPDPPAQGRRALLRAHQSRRHQFRAARGSPQQNLLRQPHAALSQRTDQA